MREAVSLATLDGLDGLSIGNLADALEMSKSGVYAHFGSKQELQLATVDEAGRIFQLEVIGPAMAAPTAVARLVAVCDAFFDHLERRTFPGGCFLRRGGAGDGHPARPGRGPGGRLPDGVPPAPAAAGGRSRARRQRVAASWSTAPFDRCPLRTGRSGIGPPAVRR